MVLMMVVVHKFDIFIPLSYIATPEVLLKVRWNSDKIVFADAKQKTKAKNKTINP
jgi:hypothetical protein